MTFVLDGRQARSLPQSPRPFRRTSLVPEGCPHRSAGAYLVDHLAARGISTSTPDHQALARIARTKSLETRAVDNQTTADTPGILPTPIVGPIISLIDANRPLVTSLGAKPAPTGGKTFTRPKVTQHTAVGPQTAEKTELPSQKMIIGYLPFTKGTFGGTVDISRQDVDWTSPPAWDALLGDLAAVYSQQTEAAVAAAFPAAATGGPVPVAANTLKDWVGALYLAGAHSYSASQAMPNRVWISLDVWAQLGSLVDIDRNATPPGGNLDTAMGSSDLASFRGDVLALPRIVVPTFPDGTCIVGNSLCYEVYEEVIGLLSVVEPSILGITVAYGGYVAYGAIEAAGLVKVTPPAPAVQSASKAAKQ
jgi:hypothetical protein